MSIFSFFKRKKLNREFFMAVCRGSVDGVKYKIEEGADVNCRDDVYLWSKEKKDDVFYRKGPSINDSEYYIKKCGRTALAFAVKRKYVELVELLCESGADVNAGTLRKGDVIFGDTINTTPLMEVLGDSSDDIKISQILIDHGTDINLKDSNGRTAFFRQAISLSPCFDIVKLLVECGSDINAKDYSGKYVIDFLYEHLQEKSSRDPKDHSSIVKIIDLLVNKGINLNSINITKEELMDMLNGGRSNGYVKVKDNDKTVSDLIHKGDLESLSRQFDNAISAYSEAISHDPANFNAYHHRGIAYRIMKNYDLAIKDFNKAIEINPSVAKSYSDLGAAYDECNQFELAIANYDKSISLDPLADHVYTLRGFSYSSINKLDRAIHDFDKAIELNPERHNNYNQRGVAYSNKGFFDQAINDFNKAIELNPKGSYAYFNRGATYENMGKTDNALADFKKAAHLGSQQAQKYLNELKASL